jgi:DNA-binding MarR family transcriptional regulator
MPISPRNNPSNSLPGSSLTDSGPVMNLEEWRDLQLLEAVEEKSTVTQRTLSARLGIALGLTNLYVKRLIRKGHLKSVTMPPNRLVYFVTPRGVQRKARLAVEFMKYSLDLYRKARRDLRRGLRNRLAEQKSVAIFGTGEAAELAFLLLREIGVEPAAVFDGAGGQRFLGFEVRGIKEHQAVEYDILIVARLEKVQSTLTKLLAAGVPKEKLLLLREEPRRSTNGAQAI